MSSCRPSRAVVGMLLLLLTSAHYMLTASQRNAAFSTTKKASNKQHYTRTKDSCFTPHPYFDLLNENNNKTLPFPIIGVGFPKAGTMSLDSFFRCGFANTTRNISHYHCLEDEETQKRWPNTQKRLCGPCMHDAVQQGKPPLYSCGNYDAFLQLDETYSRNPSFCYWPQVSTIHEIHDEAPHATLLLNTRNVTRWYFSLQKWNNFHQRIGKCPNLWYGSNHSNMDGSSLQHITNFFCHHVEFIRDFVLKNPSHALVEVDIEDPKVGMLLSKRFGIPAECWGHENANPKNQY